MRKLLWISLFALVLSLGLVGCATTREGGANETKAKMTDTDLKNNIKAKLDSDPQLKAADLSVSADAENNTATLSGTVPSETLRTRALELAKSAHPGLVIKADKIDVKLPETSRSEYTKEQAEQEWTKAKTYGDKVGDTLDDAWIHMKIVSKLIGNSKTPERKINVDVVNNVVTLRGTVDKPEAKAEAVRVAKETEGVKSVIDQLKVGGTKKAG